MRYAGGSGCARAAADRQHAPLADCLSAVARAIDAGKPIASVLLQGRGYDFASGQALLRDLRSGLAPEALAAFEAHLDGMSANESSSLSRRLLQRLGSSRRISEQSSSMSAREEDRLEAVQARLLDTLPNIIAINWHLEGGDNQLAAMVEDVFCRLPKKPTRLPKKPARLSSSMRTRMRGWPGNLATSHV